MMQVKDREFVIRFMIRVLIYILGMFIISLGVAISINSDLGVSPVNSLPYVISQFSGVSLSICVTTVFSLYVALQIVLLRREFQIIQLTQILFSVIFGYFVDFSKRLIGDFAIPTYAGRLLMLAISIFLIALGITAYIQVKLVPMAMEGFILAVTDKIPKLSFHRTKILVDCSVVVVGILLSYAFAHRLIGIREGTIIAAAAVGKAVGLLHKPLGPVIDRLCFSAETP